MFANTLFLRLGVILLLCCGLFGCGVGAGVPAENAGGELRRITQTRFVEVDAKLAAQQWQEALALLDRLGPDDLEPYERAVFWIKRANVYSGMKRYEQAADALRQSVELRAMPDAEQVATTHRLVNLYVGLRRYEDAVALIDSAGLAGKQPNPEQAFTLALAYAGAKREQDALPHAQAAVAGSSAPEELKLQLLCDLQQHLQHYAEAAALAEQMVRNFPNNKQHYLRLAASYEQLDRSEDALRVLERAHEQGLLSQELELLALIDLAAKVGQGGKAAAWLEQHMGDGKLGKTPENRLRLARCWLAAGQADRAQRALEDLDEDAVPGDVFLDLGKLYTRRGEWVKAREPLALSLGRSVASPGTAYLLLGIVHYQTSDKAAALQALGKAERHQDAVACAKQWLGIVGKGRSSKEATCPTEMMQSAAK